MFFVYKSNFNSFYYLRFDSTFYYRNIDKFVSVVSANSMLETEELKLDSSIGI